MVERTGRALALDVRWGGVFDLRMTNIEQPSSHV